MSEHLDFEPIPGLPQKLPEGERILWQGRPEWKVLARQCFRLRFFAMYFAIFLTLRIAATFQGRLGVLGIFQAALAALVSLGILALASWLHARATVYTLTTRRIVLRIGIALPMAWNLPFKRLASADVRSTSGGVGDIVLRLAPPDRIAWLHLWPHVAPGHVLRAQPALRAIADAMHVAQLLRLAVTRWSAEAKAHVTVSNELPTPHAAPEQGPAESPALA